MAVKNFYLLDSAVAAGGDYGAMQEDGTAPATANQATGWVIGTLVPTRYADMDRGVQVPRTDADATFGYITTIPANAPQGTRGNAFRTPNTLSGTFANANWTFSFVMRATSGTAQRGAMRCRVYRSANADGSSPTLVGTALETGITAAASTTNTTAITATMNPGALTLTNEYLFFVLTWKITTAGANNANNWVITTNTNTKVLTSDLAVVLSKSVTDSLSLADASAAALTQARSTTDVLSLADTSAVALTKARVVTDTLSVADSVSRDLVLGGLTASATDTLTVADGGAPIRSLTIPRAVTDSLTLADSQLRATAASRALTDSLTLADSNQRARALTRSATDSLALVDSRSTVRAIARAIVDTLTLADGIASQGSGQINRSINDALSTLDAVSTARSIARSNTDALALADVTVQLVALTRALADELALADSEAAGGSLARVLVDTLAVEDLFTSDAPLALPSDLAPSNGRNTATLTWMLDEALPRSYRASNLVGKSQSTATVVSNGRDAARVNR